MSEPNVARCKWCAGRTGQTSYRVYGIWHKRDTLHRDSMIMVIQQHEQGMTDTICPACLKKKKRPQAGTPSRLCPSPAGSCGRAGMFPLPNVASLSDGATPLPGGGE